MPLAGFSVSALRASGLSETRTVDGYVREVETYLETMRTSFQAALRVGMIRRRLGAIRTVLANVSDTNLREVQLQIHIAGQVEAFFVMNDVKGHYELPQLPAPWGTHSFAATLAQITEVAVGGVSAARRGGYTENSASTRILYKTVDLRPRHEVSLDAVHLVVPASGAERELTASWTATSSNMDGVAQGELRIALAANIATAAEVLERPTAN
jgi:hypothetical protein